jgi:hypothetical protein
LGYYLRVLSPREKAVPALVLRESVGQLGAHLRPDTIPTDWNELDVIGPSRDTLCSIERNVVHSGSLGQVELAEFRDEIADCKPQSAADWLDRYFQSVRTIYAFQVHGATYDQDGWGIVGAAHQAIWNAAGGITQADGEGFSNEDGYHILWQFSDGVAGTWSMAVLKDGRWRKFEMDLGDPEHRKAFHRGDIPEGVKPLD